MLIPLSGEPTAVPESQRQTLLTTYVSTRHLKFTNMPAK
jgi:hypothetical protein